MIYNNYTGANKMLNFKLLFLIVFFTFLTGTVNSQTFIYDFSSGYEEWSGDFADYPISDSLFYELAFYRAKLPSPLNTNKYALLITGNNHSDDLFMFIKRKVTGLLPNTTYKLMISVDFASKYPTNSIGVGGSPGEGVTLKAGASVIEPQKIVRDGYFRMNVDKGSQITPGVDMDTIGNVGVTDTTTVYALINRNNTSHLFEIRTDSNGELWICIGTDSGYESTTALYYDKITLIFNSVTGVDNNKSIPGEFQLFQNYPNPFNPNTTINFSVPKESKVTMKIFDVMGKEIETLLNDGKPGGYHNVEFNGSKLASGIYFYRMQADDYTETKKLILIK